MALKSYDEYLKEIEESGKAKLDERLNTSNSSYEAQKKTVTDTYNNQINDTSDSYEDLYRQNAVQKLINEREVAENMANLGLTNSGLNRTQQTAVQLSYANNRAKFDVSRQKAVDSLASELASKISSLDIAKEQAAQSIRDTWKQENETNAYNLYKADVEAETARYKAEQEQIAATNKAYYSAQEKILSEQAKYEKENSYIIKANGATLSYNFQGSLKDNGVSVIYGNDGKTTYVDTKSGKKTVLYSTINPYTGTTNEDVYNGAFGNGYQPDNIGGKKLTKVKDAQISINGRTQSVWTIDDGKSCYFWDGGSNKYQKLTGSEKKLLGIK